MNGRSARKKFLNKNANELLRQYNAVLNGEQFICQDSFARKQMWGLLEKIIEDVDEPVSFTFEPNTSVNEKIDQIMVAISNGEITPKQGETLMGILRSGFEVCEMQQLMGKLQEAGLIENTVV